MKALIWKELRENGRWLPLGWVIVTFACLMSLPSRQYVEAGLSSRLTLGLALLGPLMAFSLGVLQTFRDTQAAAGGYLQHRCVTEQQVFWSKMIAAMVVYLTAIVLPLVLFACWIEMHGLEKYPMRPIEVLPALACSLLAFSLYPATLMMMTRSASWWGTRWFPMVFAVSITGVFSLASDHYAMKMSFVVGFIAIAVVSWLSLTALSFWHGHGERTHRWLQVGYLSVCSVIIVTFGVHLVWGIVGETEPSPDQVYNQFEIETKTRKPWLLMLQFYEDEKTHKQKRRVLGGAPIDGSPVIDPTTPISGEKEFTEYGFNYMFTSELNVYPNYGFINAATEFERSQLQYFYDDRGYLLGYQAKPKVRWVQTIAADGVYKGGELAGKPFTRRPIDGFRSFREAGYPIPLIDSNGVYLVDDDSGSIRTLIEGPIDGQIVTDPKDGSTPRMFILSQGTLSEYRFLNASGSEDWFEAPPEGVRFEKLQSLAVHGLVAEIVQSVQVPDSLLNRRHFGVATTDTGIAVLEDEWSRRFCQLSSDKPAELIEFSLASGTEIPRGYYHFNLKTALCGLIPAAMLAAMRAWNLVDSNSGFSAGYWLQGVWLNDFQTTVLFSVFAVACLVAVLLTLVIAWKYELNRRTTMGWVTSVLALGLAAPLAMIATYDRPRRELCSACSKARRIDAATCEHCGAEWQVPMSEGIEIVDRAA